MFTVQNIMGQRTDYVQGAIRARRRTDGVEPVLGLQAIEQEQITPEAKGNQAELSRPLKHYQDSSKRNTPPQRILLASDLMHSPVFTLAPEVSLEEAWHSIVAHRFRHIPIAINKIKLVGIVSDRDLLRKFAQSRTKPNLGDPLSSIMHSDILTATPDTEIREIAKVLIAEKIGCMPILSESNELVGIITRSDILRALIVKAPLELWI